VERPSVIRLRAEPGWLSQALDCPRVTDICINGSGAAFLDQGRGLEPIEGATNWNEEALRDWVLEKLAEAGKSWDAKNPFIDATIPSGHRIHIAFPPIARKGLLVSLRRLPSQSENNCRWNDSPLFPLLRDKIIAGDSIVICGATGSGKTTLANDLLSSVPGNERIVALEDTPELMPNHPHFLSLISRPPNADGCGEVTLRNLLKQTLRMRPDRIILGECRGEEVLELLQALNTGHRGALATLHANSPREALRRLELLCLLAAKGSLTLGCIRELLVLGLQWLVQVTRTGPRRTISDLWKIEGREGDTILMRPMVKTE
jgi:pilus assembly protein CpaF